MSSLNFKKLFTLKSTVLKNIGLTFSAQMFSRLLSAVSLMIVLRHIARETYGLVSLFQSSISVASGFILTGVNWGMIREIAAKVHNQNETKVIDAAFRFTLICALLLSAVVAFFYPFQNQTLSGGLLNWYLVLLAWGIVASSLMNFSIALLQAKSQFTTMAVALVSQGLLTLLFYVVLAVWHRLSLILILLATSTTPLLFIMVIVGKGYLHWSSFRGALTAVASIVKQYRWYVIYSSLLLLVSQMDVFMMANFFTPEDVGVYSVAAKLYGILLLALSAVHSVLLPAFSGLSDQREMYAKLKRSFNYTVPAALILLVVSFLFSRFIITLFAGNSYNEAITPFRILSIGSAISIIFSPSVNVLFALNKVRRIAFSGCLLITVAFLGHLLLTSRYGAIGAAAVTVVAYATINIFVFCSVRRLAQQS